MACEMCGKSEAVLRASIEGTVLSVCEACSRYGKVVGRIATAQPAREHKAAMQAQAQAAEEIVVVADFGVLVKRKRDQLGLTQEEFAQKIAVKESVLHRMETGAAMPSLKDAERVGRLLGLKLTEKAEGVDEVAPPQKSDQLTLGDLIRIKRK